MRRARRGCYSRRTIRPEAGSIRSTRGGALFVAAGAALATFRRAA